ncbi:universal stress protein [Steroidobacter agaridevorans]|uniref:universal stress protein n=1 Tax=Steroidobacter agaridevorans TaxID=2695856 RepID=UPI001327D285|nr:universal stress protein [Steroidobacter agaridevorans]GFE91334.1 universal stress protein [Steroidobacter agaridevorans]
MYRRILVPVDGSAAASQGLDEAIELASNLKARLRLVHVVEPIVMMPAEAMAGAVIELAEGIRQAGSELLKECEQQVAKAGVEVDRALIEALGRSAGECVVKEAEEAKADLIVCGTHGRRGVRRLLMGSDAEYIVRRAPVPVLLVRHQPSAAAEAA